MESLGDRARLEPDGFERFTAVLEANPELARAAADNPSVARSVAAAAQASRALTAFLMDDPVPSLVDEPPAQPDEFDPIALRRFVEGRLVRTAVRDLLGMADMPTVGRELSDTADAAAAAALTIAQADTQGPDIPFTVIAMGKWGAQELNYASDIDVLFVYDTPDDTDPETARRHANHLAARFISALADVTTEGIAYRVDADLRPEGRNGPLARSLDSYAAYYKRWAHTWEYQSLIKARPAAGDPTLGTAFTSLATTYVYPDTLAPDAIRNIRTMKARIEHQPRDTTFHLKHGPGGLSDVEFFTQLLQMKHGNDASLRTQGTLPGLRKLAEAGVLTDDQAQDMIDAYRFGARVRNRLYLQLGKPVENIPTDPLQSARLGRSLGYENTPRSSLREEYRRLTRRARNLVETGFYHDL